MKTRPSRALVVTASLLFVLVVTAQRAEAADFTFTFGGTITSVQKGYFDTIPAPWNEVHVDDVWTLTYSFDDTDTDAAPTISSYGVYQCAILSYRLEVGSVTVAGRPPCGLGWITVGNNTYGVATDYYGIELGDTPKHVDLRMDLVDMTASAFASDALPTLIPTPLATTFAGLGDMALNFVSDVPPGQPRIEGSVDWFAPGSLVTVSPPTGTYALTQEFDLTVLARTHGQAITYAQMVHNGVDRSQPFVDCMVVGSAPGDLLTFRCPGITGSLLGVGEHTLEVTLEYADGVTASDTVEWTILENSEP